VLKDEALQDMPQSSIILKQYRELLGEVDLWFATCLTSGGSGLNCRGGCSACCRGLFDITLLDAWLLKDAFAGLAAEVQAQVISRCQLRLAELGGRWPALRAPYFLNGLPEEEWTAMPEEDQMPCPLLDAKGYCMVYPARPLTCRLHGLPNVDLSGEDFDGTVCTLHTFPPTSLPEQILRWRFREVFSHEVVLFRTFTKELTGSSWHELDTFIPLALLADYAAVDWCNFKL
jgi:Fe-S-cluster containining protein